MDVAVLLKQVPDTETVIKIGADGKSIDTSGLKWVNNPYDEYAVEAALRLKDSQAANVTILSLGPQRTVESIRSALAMGADKGILMDDPATEGSDALGKKGCHVNHDLQLFDGSAFTDNEGFLGRSNA